MHKLIAVSLVALFGLATIASAATLTLTFTQTQVDAATWAYNNAPAAERAAYPTLAAWFANRVSGLIDQYAAQKAASEAASVCTRFNAMTSGNKTTACNFFSLTSGQTFASDPSGCMAVCP